MALMETLYDDFSDPAASATKWTTIGNVTYSGGQAVLTGDPAGTVLYSTSVYTFGFAAADSTYLVAKVTLSGGATDFEMQIWDTANQAKMTLQITGGNLVRKRIGIAGAVSSAVVGAYNPTTMAYLRLRSNGTSCNIAYSADGITWVDVVHNTFAFNDYNNIQARFVHGTTNPAHVITIDNVNGALTDTLRDDFSSGALDTNKWKFVGDAGTSQSIVSGALNIHLNAGLPTGTDAYVGSVSNFRIRDSYVVAKVTHGAAPLWNATLMVISPTTDERFYMQRSGSNLQCRGYDGGSFFATQNVAYTPATMAWWGIWYTAGTFYFRVSADGKIWNLMVSGAYVIKQDYCNVRLTGVYGTGTTIADDIQFDDVNSMPSYTPDSLVDVSAVGSPTAALTIFTGMSQTA